MLFTDAHLDSVIARKSRPANSALSFFAENRSSRRRYLSQLRMLFAALPEEARNDRSLLSNLSSLRDDTFFGAVDLMTAHWVLNQFVLEGFDYEPNVDGKTPDLGTKCEGDVLFAEVTRVSEPEDPAFLMIADECKGVESDYWVSGIEAAPDSTGNFHGISNELARLLRRTDLEENAQYELRTARGARVVVDLVRAGERITDCVGGWIGKCDWGDWAETQLRNALLAKSKKYKFPLLLVVVTRPFHPRPRTLRRMLMGSDGYWVSSNLDSNSVKRLDGIIHIRCVYDDQDGLMRLKPYALWNPNRNTAWREHLADLPAVGEDGRVEELVLVPPEHN